MKLIVLIFFSTIFFEGNPQLVHSPTFLSKLKGDVSNNEPYEVQSKKTTLLGEKHTNLKPQDRIDSQNIEKPQLIDQNNSPSQRIKYKNNKKHILDDLAVHIDTENAFIDYEKNDTIETQRQLVEIESMIIKPSKDNTNLLDFSLDDESDSGESIDENTNHSRRLLNDTPDLPIPKNDSEISKNDANSFQNDELKQTNQSNQSTPSIELNSVNDNREPLIPIDVNKNENIKPLDVSSSALQDSDYKIEDKDCDNTDDNKISEEVGIPTIGRGITELVKSRMMLFNHPRTCYACNSNRDKSCWSPNRQTPVKYCAKNQNFCFTKLYQKGGMTQVLRDCGESCSSTSEVTCGVAYASCTICESDLCNSAETLTIQRIVSMLIIAINIILGACRES